MPELPEIEILCKEINNSLQGCKISDTYFDKYQERPKEISALIIGNRIIEANRVGKMLIIKLSNDFCIIIHLMIVGQLTHNKGIPDKHKETALILFFDDKTHLIANYVSSKYFHYVYENEISKIGQISKSGIDPFSQKFTLEAFSSLLKKKKGKIKPLLINGSFIAGIGNTYSDEILFEAKIHPEKTVKDFSRRDTLNLYQSIIHILQKGVEFEGSSEMAFVHLNGEKGKFQENFQVNRRKGQNCFTCGSVIERITVSGKGTYICPRCQN